jgi:hypothetical protein
MRNRACPQRFFRAGKGVARPAEMAQRHRVVAQHMRVIRREAERLRVARKRVLDAVELQQRIAAMT